MAENYVLLETIELTQNASSIVFNNLPSSGYSDLKIVGSTRTDRAGYEDALKITFNGSGGTAYTTRRLFGNGTSVTSSTTSGAAYAFPYSVNGNSTTSNVFASFEMYVPNYLGSTAKSFSFNVVSENNATDAIAGLHACLWDNTAAITSITFTPNSGTIFYANSTFSLYGVAATGTTPAVAPKATGGNIVANDGTYWYHAFLTSGTFTPQTALTCDALLVAGGGAGGWDLQGGGGAGGVVASNSAFAISTAQTVTIGAGGTGGTYSSVAYTSGSDTVFNSWTALGGGKGNSTGGSGGGAAIAGAGVVVTGKAATQTSPTGATGYGNAGGNSYQNGSNVFATGGGGGAGAAGSSYSGSNGGAGGAGKNTWSTWLSATNTGVSGYIAGGGGGGVYSTGTSGAGGSGGGGAGWTGAASANPASPVTEAMHGVRGTGGGGGGAGANFAGGNGGSGLVIIRYPMA